jgi:hypothetical protein
VPARGKGILEGFDELRLRLPARRVQIRGEPAATFAQADLHRRAALYRARRKHLPNNDVRDGHAQPIRECLVLARDVLQPRVERSDAQ